jgi:hypothetical protein
MRTDGTLVTSFRKTLIVLFVISLVFASNSLVSAQADNTNANTNTNGNTNTNANANKNANSNTNVNTNTNNNTGPSRNLPPCPSAEEYAQVKVTRAFKKTSQGEELTAELGDEITVEVQRLVVLLNKAKCANPTKKILLFLDGRPVKDALPFPPTDPSKNLVIFPLKRTENSRDVWTYVLGESKWTPRDTTVSVGLEDEYAVESTAPPIKLIVIPHGWFTFWVLIFSLILIAFWLLAVKSDVLRDTGPQPAESTARKPYSLARTQAAWWFFLVLASYLFIGMITGDFSTTITGTVLGLLGISAGTVMGSAFIDAGKASAPAKPTAAAVPDGGAGGGGGAAPPELPTPDVPKNEYWWVDILSDANGVSFHRFQVAGWTLVLGIIFVIQVYKVLAMPTFDGSLLALLGISAGTYLGLKIPEPTTPTK